MSKKSRQPDADAEPKGKAAKGKGGDKKAKKGKKGNLPPGAHAQVKVVTTQEGVPFAIVVLAATVMCLPSISHYLAGTLAFDALMLRLFGALAVAWILSALVGAVFESMRPTKVEAIVELTPEQAFDVATKQGAVTGTIVDATGAPMSDPFELDSLAPVEPAPEPGALPPVEPLAVTGREEESAA